MRRKWAVEAGPLPLGVRQVGTREASTVNEGRPVSNGSRALARDATWRLRASGDDTRGIGDLLLELLPLAMVCALSPWAIVAVILMLASDRPSNALWWLLGWTLSTFGIGVLIVLLFFGYDFSRSTTPTKVVCVVQLLLGLVLLVAAARFWGRRPAQTGEAPSEPGWMVRIGTMRAIWAFLIGAFWINTTLVVAAGLDTLRAELSTGKSIAVFAAFTLVTASVQGTLILYAYLRPEHADTGLTRIRAWTTHNQQLALSGVALALAIWFVSQGISGLRH
jgi:Sap-like sulfolipid-1-addressing protein